MAHDPASSSQSTQKTVLAEGRFVRLVRQGHWEFAERIKTSGIVAIVAVTDDGKMLLVEQYRPPVGGRVIEVPAGLAGDVEGCENEALVEAARRELLEETGYEAAEMVRLIDGTASAGITDEIITLFRATGLKKVAAGGGDSSEAITIHEVPVGEVISWLQSRRQQGVMVDLKVYGALYFAM